MRDAPSSVEAGKDAHSQRWMDVALWSGDGLCGAVQAPELPMELGWSQAFILDFPLPIPEYILLPSRPYRFLLRTFLS